MQGNDACCINWTSGPLLLLLKRLTVWKQEKSDSFSQFQDTICAGQKSSEKYFQIQHPLLKIQTCLKLETNWVFISEEYGIFIFISLVWFFFILDTLNTSHFIHVMPWCFFFKPKDHLGRYTTQPILRSTLQSRIGQLLY